MKRGGSEVDKKDFLPWRESGLANDFTEEGVDNVTVPWEMELGKSVDTGETLFWIFQLCWLGAEMRQLIIPCSH